MHDIATSGRQPLPWPGAGSASLADPPDALLVAVPLYRAPELIAPLVASLAAMADELLGLDATVLFINDSPGDAALEAALAEHLPVLAALVPVELTANDENLGFVRTANRALARGRDSGRDVILLNSDALPRPGAFYEMVAVAYLDPMIAAVSPRSDNATICNSPYAAECRPADRDGAWAAHRAIEPLLPRMTFVPTVVGFCMLIRRLMLSEFGLFDEIYGGGYNEENDFIRRCNQRGYRAVLANHAYVHHLGSVSFATTSIATPAREQANRAILDRRYPEYGRLIERWFDGPEFHAQRLLGGLVPGADGRNRLLLDCRLLKSFFNGTHEHLCALLRALAERHAGRFDIGVLCDGSSFRFHRLDRVAGLRHVGEAEAAAHPFAAAMRLGQPFAARDLAPLARWAPVVGVLMLDTIAMDCQQLDDEELGTLWQLMLDEVDLVGFNSGFSQDQFLRRFAVPERIGQFISRCSTEVADYASGGGAPGTGILVVGNHYPHKHVAETVAALRRRDAEVPVTVLGVPVDPTLDVRCVTAGDLPQSEVDALYDGAAVLLMPSHYEGFGLPILHGLARGRPVVARDLPSAREIRARCPQAVNLHLAATTDALVELALAPSAWRSVPAGARSPEDWGSAADALADAINGGIGRVRFETCRQRQARVAARQNRSRQQALIEISAAEPAPAGPPVFGFMLEPAAWHAPASVPDPAPVAGARVPLDSDARRDSEPVAALDLEADDEDAERVQDLLMDWLRRLPVGGRVTLTLPADARVLPDEHSAATDAGVLLVSVGCRVDAVDEGADLVTVLATKVSDWDAALPGPADDRRFVRFLYRHALGREPDRAGASNYASELAAGRGREDLLRVFLRSPERRDRIAALMKQADAG